MEWQNGSSEAVSSIRRITRTLRHAGSRFGFPRITSRAAALEAAVNGSFEKRLDDLLQVLQETTEQAQPSKVNILVVEQDEDVTDLLDIVLSTSNRAVTTARSAREARSALEQQDFALIVLGLELPDEDGRDVLVELRERKRTAVVPVFVLTARTAPQIKTECFALGADNVFHKPFDPSTFSSAVAVRLQRQAVSRSKDPLTGLPDHTAFQDAFDHLASDDLEDAPLCLAVLTPDHFEAVGDIYGPAEAEDLLRQIADLLLQSLREADLLARWTDEVYALLFPHTKLEQAAAILDRALQTIRQSTFEVAGSREINLTCSAGLVQVRPDYSSVRAPITNATYFLYAAVEQGGSMVATEGDTLLPRDNPILLVEDNHLVSTIIKDRLEREGFTIEHYVDGREALEAAPDLTPALVILDVKVPGLDGFVLLKHLRRMPSYASTPIMMLTAMSSEQDVVRGFDMGADDYLLKPFSPKELTARIKRLMTRRGVR